MNNKVLIGLFSIVPLLSHIAYSDLFLNQPSDLLDIGMSSMEDEILPMDFNGDSYIDLVVPKIDDLDFYIALNPHGENAFAHYFLRRGSTVLNERYIETDMKYIVAPSRSSLERKNSLLLVYPDGRMNVMRYIMDFDISSSERYLLFPYLLSQLHGGAIRDVALGNVENPNQEDLLVISSLGNDVSLSIFRDPFTVFSQEETVLSSPVSNTLPGLLSNWWVGSLDGNQWDDLYFECNDAWYIWLSEASHGGFKGSPATISIPAGIKKSVDAISGNDKYPLIVSVETESDSDAALVVFPANNLERPIHVSIPNKTLQGSTSRLFAYADTETGRSSPILIVYNCLDKQNPMENVFYIYSVELEDSITVKLQQRFIPKPSAYYEENGYSVYFDRPEFVADFDGDGVPDIVFMATCVPITQSVDRSIVHRSIGFSGISSETHIFDWSVYE